MKFLSDFKNTKYLLIYTYIGILCICIIFLILLKLYILNKEKSALLLNSNFSKNHYLVTNLYSNSNQFTNTYICRLKVDSITIDYPIFNSFSEKNLKLAPCLFSGSSFKSPDNMCIVGHNYNNSVFFSNLKHINLHDEVLIILPDNTVLPYHVFNIYEVDSHDFSPILSSSFDFELTLITCTNISSKRLIVKCMRK